MTTYLAHFTPYTRSGGATDPLTISLYVDGSLFELFINERFALSARTYPSRADATYLGFEGTGMGDMQVLNITYFDNMLQVWPERPLNASSPLVFDGYCQTHVCFPNPYVDEGYPLYDGYKRV